MKVTIGNQLFAPVMDGEKMRQVREREFGDVDGLTYIARGDNYDDVDDLKATFPKIAGALEQAGCNLAQCRMVIFTT